LSQSQPSDRSAGEAAVRRAALKGQNFDTCQRLATIAAVCERLAALGCTTAADVGGHPGLLADHLPPGLRCRAIVDLPSCPRPDHVCGSALALPLHSEAVDVVLSADTLEHVPDFRVAARELARVAKRAAVISAPWRRKPTEAVEEMLCRWHLQLTGMDHPWLSEHREMGLPDVDAVAEAFQARGWHTAQFACGTLTEWTLLQTALLVVDLLPAEHVDFGTFNRRYNEAWPVRLTRSLPPQSYRTVLVAAADSAWLDAIEESAPAEPSEAPPLLIGMELLDGMFTALQEAIASKGGKSNFDSAYLARLEELTRQQAAEIDALRSQVQPPSRLGRLTARLKGRGKE
jgi:hypothetical protein